MPHYNAHDKYQIITYRLSDSLPKKVFEKIELKFTQEEKLKRRREIEIQMDRGYGSCLLKNYECAKIIIDNWKYFDRKRYDLISYVVMPNHVHLLIRSYNFEIGYLVKSWKSYSAKAIRKYYASLTNAECHSALQEQTSILQKGNPFWQREYWDRFIRDEKHFRYAINYIHENPVKAGLVQTPIQWPFSSSNN